MKHEREFAEFVLRLHDKCERGAKTYGEASFDKPLPRTLDELLDELLDLSGWSWVMFVRIEALKEALATMQVDPRPRVPRTP